MSRPWVQRVVVVLVLVGLMGGAALASRKSAAAMTSAAETFLAGLTAEQRQQVLIPFESDERFRWNYIPNEMFPRKGLMIQDMTEPQRQLAHALFKTGLSQTGYMTATAIMSLEDVVRAIEATGGGDSRGGPPRFARQPLQYYVTVFGTPSAKGTWGWRLDGHHISQHFAVSNGAAVASSPSFWGTNPAEVREGPQKGLRILGPEEETGRALLMALDEPRRAVAMFEKVAPADIVSKNAAKVDPLAPAGIAASAMTAAQRDLLMKIVAAYVADATDDIAAERMEKLKKAGVEKITFAWAGEAETGKKHYYRVQGPTFLIEFDNTQNNGNHVHLVWRDFDGDFGRDLLREHVKGQPH